MAHRHVIKSIEPGSIADELGIEKGDILVSINGQEVEDVFDYHFFVNDEELVLTIEKPDGEEWELEIEKDPDEQLGIGFGQGLMDAMRAQARRLGADLRTGTVTSADLSSRPFRLSVDGDTEIEAEAMIIATGATAKYLGLPSEEKFRGMGVSACATCDGFFYRGKTVAVVGGGDTACEEATYLASLCSKVYMIVRRDVLRASEAMQEKVRNMENIEILWNCNTQEVLGDATGVTGARLLRKDGTEFDRRPRYGDRALDAV